MGVSAREVGRRLGVSKTAVLKAADRGRIPREPDGSFDFDKVAAVWAQNTDARKQRTAPRLPVAATLGISSPDPRPTESPRNSNEERPAVSNDADLPPELPSDLPDVAPGVSFLELQRRREAIRLQSDELKLARMRGELVEREQTNLAVQNLAIAEKEALMNWPSRVVAGLAAELNLEERTLRAVLEREVRKFLLERSGPPPSL